MNNEFTIEYFINKFEAIPEEDIGEGSLADHCALYHCGVRLERGEYVPTEEARTLGNIFSKTMSRENLSKDPTSHVFVINDDPNLGKTPKQRLLNTLKKLQNETSVQG